MMLLTVCLSSLLLLVRADSVHILSKKYGNDGQLITSSILNWIPESQYSASKNIVIGGYENLPGDGSKRIIFVCRAMHSGVWVAGGRKEGENLCTVSLAGSVGSYQSYQLLENVESAARVNWYNWTKIDPKPVGTVGTVGTVSTDKYFVARHTAVEQDDYKPTQTHYIGTLIAESSFGTISYVKENGEEGKADEGQLLVETEPISYELKDVMLNQMKARVEKQEAQNIGEATLMNSGSSSAVMAEAISYSYQYSDYWGQGHVMLRNLNTSITLENKTRLANIHWGLKNEETRTGLHTVEVFLAPGTGVNVTLQGSQAVVEVPYSAQLFSFYEDKASVKPRKISGIRQEKLMMDVKQVLGPVYYLSNLSLVPISELPTSTVSPDSTTSRRPISTTVEQQTMQTSRTERVESATEKNVAGDSDENSILAKRPEATGMQGDDGGPLSLKNNAEGSRNTAAQATCPATAILAFALVLVGQHAFPRVT